MWEKRIVSLDIMSSQTILKWSKKYIKRIFSYIVKSKKVNNIFITLSLL